ncbi:MAG: anthranilate phosphoribosyltransferase, partial [Betaproteobacteria bacterium]
VMIVYGLEGLDEISISGETMVAELKDGEVHEYNVHPLDFNIAEAPLESIQVSDSARSQEMLLGALDNQAGPARDIVALNAGAAIYVAGLADSLHTGVERARSVIASGAPRRTLDAFVEFTRQFKT